MKKKRILAILFLFYFVVTPIFAQKTNTIYLDDYEFIKKSMVEGYANLDWIKKDNKIDIIALDDKIKRDLEKATTVSEAKNIFDNFLSIFKDGHLELLESNSSSIGIATKINFKTDSKELCSFIGNENILTYKFSLPFDNIENFKIISAINDPFPIALFKLENGKQYGVLRIAVFSPDFYIRNCEESWQTYQKNFVGDCEDSCLENFSVILANNLLEKLNQQLKVLQKYKIESLIIDIGNNGGGTNWTEAIARTIASKQLIASKFSLVKNPKSVEIFEADLKEIIRDLKRDDLNKTEIKYLTIAKKNLELLINQVKVNCENSTFWTINENTKKCSTLSETPLFASGIFAYLNPKKIQNLNSKSILFSPSQYNYKESVLNNNLIVLIDENTASAAEYFAALLKDNKAAVILGSKTYGAGGGFVDGGVEYILPNTHFILKIPNCTRFRADGSNEVRGVEPDVIVWDKKDNPKERLNKLLNVLDNSTIHKI